jgi:hypothetical protein
MTHELIPDCFLGDKRGQFVRLLFQKDIQERMRAAWTAFGIEFQGEAVPAAGLEVFVFRHNSCVCAHFTFPPARAGEAALGLIVAGPSETWGQEVAARVPVRYYVLQVGPNRSTLLMEWTPQGFVELGPGPAPGIALQVFSDLVFDRLFGKKRPTAAEAARRLLVLKHLVIYAHASTYGKRLHECPDLPQAAKADLHTIMGGMFSEQLRRENLWEYVTPTERQLFDTPVAALTQQQVINASWRSEAIGILLWALGLTPQLPAYDSPAHGEITKQVPGGDLASFINSARLRDEKEIDHAREIAELWNWRSRTRQLMEQGYPYQPTEALKKVGLNTMDDVVRMSARTAAEKGNLPPCINDDFPAKGKAYRDLTTDEWSEVRSVSAERHYALNWLCGFAPGNDWDHTPTET